MKYLIGDKVIFIDENQREIRGRIADRNDFPDRIILKIRLDDNSGYYNATLLRRRRL